MIDCNEISHQLLSLGVQPEGVLVVHAAFSKVRPIEGGPQGLIAALLTALGPKGTLVMPSMSGDDDHPFNPKTTACLGMGVVADTFWRMPNVMRSDSPHAFAAIGPQAAQITAAHPFDVPHGLDSPIGRVYELDGQVLLLGIGHEANTTIHLAENMAGVCYRLPKHLTIIKDGQLARLSYSEIDHCCQNFNLLDEWLETNGQQRRGLVGNAEARLARSRDVVATALAHLRENETIFLHPAGLCGECDEARASLFTLTNKKAANPVDITIRTEAPEDVAAIDAITAAAFRDAPHTSHTEQFIVKALRNAGALSVSLVAERNGAVIGHVAVSRVSISDGTLGWFGLGPISVSPEFQRRGVGSQLMHAALSALREIGAAGCVLAGNPAYYGRFGFKPEPGLVLPDVPPEYFLVLSFGQYLPRGVVSYHEAFGAQE